MKKLLFIGTTVLAILTTNCTSSSHTTRAGDTTSRLGAPSTETFTVPGKTRSSLVHTDPRVVRSRPLTQGQPVKFNIASTAPIDFQISCHDTILFSATGVCAQSGVFNVPISTPREQYSYCYFSCVPSTSAQGTVTLNLH